MLSAARIAQWGLHVAPPASLPASLAASLAAPRAIGRVVACDGAMIAVAGFRYPIGTAVRIGDRNSGATAEIIGFRDNRAVLTRMSAGSASLALGDPVHAIGRSDRAQTGDALLGRVIDALGTAIDGRPMVRSSTDWLMAGAPLPALLRGRVTDPFDSGVRAINALLTLGRGQRAAIIAGSGVGKSVLIGQILAGAQVDRIVIGLIGERGREISDFLETRLSAAARAKCVVIAATADEAPMLRLRAAQRATAIAESWRADGHHVLLMIDSLTRIAHAQREIGLALGEPPTVKGYPPSVFGLIPALVERAGVDSASGGAITALYTVLADGDDVQDPVVDAARAIVDGHIILSRTLAEAQVYPAIDIGQSISRVMPDVADRAHLAAAAHYRRLWSTYAENRDLLLMGAYKSGSDPWLDTAIAARPAMLEFLGQAMDARVPMAAAVAQLLAEYGNGGAA